MTRGTHVNLFFLNNIKSIRPWFFFVSVIGISLRIILPLHGFNYDVVSFRIVADIVSAGGNVYNETFRYNYGPIWFTILHFLDMLPSFDLSSIDDLHLKIAIFLTAVDFGIFIFLFKQYSLKIASLFFLNPISIIITGYHSQFDNFAVFIGLLSMALYCKGGRTMRILGLIGLGESLALKHILFAFPVWLAIKEKKWSGKLMVLIIPYIFFICSFLSYLPDSINGILSNVFLYRSFSNAPFWSLFAPNVLFVLLPKVFLFLTALFLLGFYWINKPPLESINLYLISLVVFSSAIANQYLAICTPSIAVLWNWAYALYTLSGTIFLFVHVHGLHLDDVIQILRWKGEYGYSLLIFFLSLGLLISALGKSKLYEILCSLKNLFSWFANHIKAQIKSQW